jgi:murein L,D-transpeptidase YcbB/YkuD
VTDSGVKSFQRNNGLIEDGAVGLDTKKALRNKLFHEDIQMNIEPKAENLEDAREVAENNIVGSK